MLTQKLDEVLTAAVSSGDVPGAAVLAADRSGLIYSGSAGPRAAGEADPMTVDTVLRIASMTKMVTTVAALRLAEQGLIDLDAPVDTYRPEFADLPVLAGFDGDTPVLRPPTTRATIRQLMSHTGGLAYWISSAEIDRWEQVTGTPNVLAGQLSCFTAPLVSDPGTRWEYGINVEWLGLVVEAVAGEPLDAHIRTAITDPLGMTDTTARMSDAQRARSAPVHVRGEDGGWVATDIDWVQEPEFHGGGGYLYSTPQDYLAFTRMLLRGGALEVGGEHVRILAERTVAQAFTNQIGDLAFPAVIPSAHPELLCPPTFGEGLKFGLGLMLNPARRPGMRGAGSGSWWGLTNCHFWVDPAIGVTAGIFVQALPFADPGAWRLYENVERTLYASL